MHFPHAEAVGASAGIGMGLGEYSFLPRPFALRVRGTSGKCMASSPFDKLRANGLFETVRPELALHTVEVQQPFTRRHAQGQRHV